MSEQKVFELQVDAKIEVWERSYFKVIGESESEAVDKLKTHLERGYLSSFDGDSELGIDLIGGSEMIYETEQHIPVEENDGQSTLEIYCDDERENPKWTNATQKGGITHE